MTVVNFESFFFYSFWLVDFVKVGLYSRPVAFYGGGGVTIMP